jgi:hypothetical protein
VGRLMVREEEEDVCAAATTRLKMSNSDQQRITRGVRMHPPSFPKKTKAYPTTGMLFSTQEC